MVKQTLLTLQIQPEKKMLEFVINTNIVIIKWNEKDDMSGI